jgi:succinate dehydrogenase / fumarate reductase, cytochrome b subunit
MPSRPLSPHLSVYKFKYTLTTSILNRLTGLILSAGLLVLVYWLMAVAGGAAAQERATRLLATPYAKLVFAALIASFCYHLVAGLRHLVWDTGRYLERAQSHKSAWLVGIVSILLTLLVGYCAFKAGTGAP